MRIVVTADLHYDISRSREPARQIAAEICGLHADALLVLGDAAGRQLDILRECLHLFDAFAGRKFFVAGNHDIWTDPGQDSLHRLEHVLPEVVRAAGFHPLDLEPARLNGVALVGCMGWYDFSYRPERLGIPLRFYREKIAPGAAAHLGGYDHLLEERHDIPESAMRIGTRWMDGRHVRLPTGMGDAELCDRLAERFDRHLTEIGRDADQVVVGLHHLPFHDLVPQHENPSWAFAAAYLGGEAFGRVLLKHPKVRYAFCGHSHHPVRVQREHVHCVNVGATYTQKRYEVLEL